MIKALINLQKQPCIELLITLVNYVFVYIDDDTNKDRSRTLIVAVAVGSAAGF